LARVLVARRMRVAFFEFIVRVSNRGPMAAGFKLALLLLRFLHHHAFTDIAHALALIWLGRTVGADLGGHLPDLLLVGTLDHDLGRGRCFDGDTFRHWIVDRVREAQRQAQAGPTSTIGGCDLVCVQNLTSACSRTALRGFATPCGRLMRGVRRLMVLP